MDHLGKAISPSHRLRSNVYGRHPKSYALKEVKRLFKYRGISRCICDMRAHCEYWTVESELFTTAYSVDSSHRGIPRYCRSWTTLANCVLLRGPCRGCFAALGIWGHCIFAKEDDSQYTVWTSRDLRILIQIF